jgi:GNAT superfamily N-acetyltransferase
MVPRMTAITHVLATIERCYDALPRVDGAVAEPMGSFVLFRRTGPGWPFYARPRLDAVFDPAEAAPAAGLSAARAAEVTAVLARQRELGVPLALEWVHEVTPTLLPAAAEAGLVVLRAPLMVLDPARLPRPERLLGPDDDAAVRVLDPDASEFAEEYARSGAVAEIGFGGEPAADATDPTDPTDAVAPAVPSGAELDAIREPLRRRTKGHAVVATTPTGVVARGAYQAAVGCAEIVGVATLPAARRRGYGAAVSAALARHALDAGHDLVFLSAASEDVARVYARIGFRHAATACIAAPRG